MAKTRLSVTSTTRIAAETRATPASEGPPEGSPSRAEVLLMGNDEACREASLLVILCADGRRRNATLIGRRRLRGATGEPGPSHSDCPLGVSRATRRAR